MRLSKVFDEIAAGRTVEAADVDSLAKDMDILPKYAAMLKQNIAATGQSEYLRQLIALDPSQWLGKIDCPVLALNGTKDTQVNATRNLAVIKSCVNGATIKSYDGLNHLFQPATTGELTEYETITTTISPQVLKDIADYISAAGFPDKK